MADEAIRNDEIAARLNTPLEVVSKWRKRLFEERLAGLEDRSRHGRSPVLSLVTLPVEIDASRRARRFHSVVVAVKAMACDLPSMLGVPVRTAPLLNRAGDFSG